MTKHDSDTVAAIHHELHSHLPSESALRTKALESLLVEKGMVDSAAVDAWIDAYSEDIGPKNGARIVARFWSDPAFAKRLLENAGEAIKELGYEHEHLIAVENTPRVHNIVVCTLCSCYPTPLLGMPPNWYKMAAYRARAVRDPSGVLGEFGVSLGQNVEIRVWDSTAEIRYIVIPQRPDGTEGWDEARLAELVTRNSMIGTHRDLSARLAEAD
jgi:nitrile hydratase